MDLNSTHLFGFYRIVAIAFEPIEAANETIFCSYRPNKHALNLNYLTHLY